MKNKLRWFIIHINSIFMSNILMFLLINIYFYSSNLKKENTKSQ
jgi:hypothetical protein